MKRLNNKGQSLVLFILLLPLILGIMALVFDLGNALTKKNEIDNVIEMVLESDLKMTYREDTGVVEDITNKDNVLEDDDILDENIVIDDRNIEDISLTSIDNNTRKETIEVLLAYNLENIEINVDVNEDTIVIEAMTYVEGIFSNILSIKGFRVESEYKGYLDSKEIEKIK